MAWSYEYAVTLGETFAAVAVQVTGGFVQMAAEPFLTDNSETRSLISSRFLFRDTRFPLFPTPPGRPSSVTLERCFDRRTKSVYSVS